MGVIYKLTFSSGKSYIGQTTVLLSRRICDHRASARTGVAYPVYRAWRKYGEPVCVVLLEVEDSGALADAEIAAIRDHGTLRPQGYNVAHGGRSGMLGRTHTAQARKKISEKGRGRIVPPHVWTPQRRAQQSERMRARCVSEETRAKMREAGKRVPEEARRRTPETRKRMSAAAFCRPPNPAARAKQAATLMGRVASPETKAKMAASQRARRALEAAKAREGC